VLLLLSLPLPLPLLLLLPLSLPLLLLLSLPLLSPFGCHPSPQAEDLLLSLLLPLLLSLPLPLLLSLPLPLFLSLLLLLFLSCFCRVPAFPIVIPEGNLLPPLFFCLSFRSGAKESPFPITPADLTNVLHAQRLAKKNITGPNPKSRPIPPVSNTLHAFAGGGGYAFPASKSPVKHAKLSRLRIPRAPKSAPR